MKKYMFVVTSLSKGGAERVVSILASELVKQGREVVVMTYFKTTQDYAIDSRVKLLCLSGGTEDEYENIGKLQRLAWMRRTIREEKPDFILPFLNHVCVQTWLACMGLKKKIAYTVRNFPGKGRTVSHVDQIHRYLMEHATVALAQNEDQRSCYAEKAWPRIHVLPNPVLPSYFDIQHAGRNARKCIVAVGRLENQKNYSLLLSAVAVLACKRQDFQLEIYGDGSQKEALQALIAQEGLSDVVQLMGRIPDTCVAYEKADLYILSSDFEGMPNALMEAMASGLMCISTDCPTGPRDLINNHENGLLIPVGDKDALVEAMTFCLEHEEVCIQYATRARETVATRYRPEIIVHELIDILENTYMS